MIDDDTVLDHIQFPAVMKIFVDLIAAGKHDAVEQYDIADFELPDIFVANRCHPAG